MTSNAMEVVANKSYKKFNLTKLKRLEVEHWYMIVRMEYEDKTAQDMLTAELVQVILRRAVDVMFGETSSSLPLDILKFNVRQGQVLVRVPASNYAKVRAALTLCSSMCVAGREVPVVFSVQQASSCLLSLAGPQRCLS